MRTLIVSASLGLGAPLLISPALAAGNPVLHKTIMPAALQPAHPSAEGKSSGTKAQPNFDAMLALLDKMFPPQPEPEAARLALARISVEPMWPNGAYGKMMGTFIGGMFDRAMQMKASDLAALGNKPQLSGPRAKADLSIHDQAAAKDPHFDQRMAAIRDILDQAMVKISAVVDPRMRDGLARAMARRFDARQLADINAFFATPSGHAMASQYMQLWLDPDTMRSMMGSLPEMMTLMPDLTDKFKAVEAKYPKPVTAPPRPAKK